MLYSAMQLRPLPSLGVRAGSAGPDTHFKAVHRGAVRPDEQRRQQVLAAVGDSREQLFSCKGLSGLLAKSLRTILPRLLEYAVATLL